jgi:hypothetical protein
MKIKVIGCYDCPLSNVRLLKNSVQYSCSISDAVLINYEDTEDEKYFPNDCPLMNDKIEIELTT